MMKRQNRISPLIICMFMFDFVRSFQVNGPYRSTKNIGKSVRTCLTLKDTKFEEECPLLEHPSVSENERFDYAMFSMG